MDRKEFEEFVRTSPRYSRLIFCYGERLFIFEDGEYRILAMQLAWEAWLIERCYSDKPNQFTDCQHLVIIIVLWVLTIITALAIENKFG